MAPPKSASAILHLSISSRETLIAANSSHCMMKTKDSTRAVLLVVVVVSSSGAETSTIWPASDLGDVMADSMQMVGSVISTLLQDKCYAIHLSDGSTSHATIFKMDELRSAWGIGVFEVVEDGQDTNETQAQLSRVVGQARQMRRISSCVMMVVVSVNPVFLTAFAESSLNNRLLVWSSKLLVVTRLPKEDFKALLTSHWTFSMMNTMELNIDPPSQSKGCSLLVHLPYSPDGAQVVKLASWTPDRGLRYLTSLTPFPEKYLNFHGATINVAVPTWEPYWRRAVKGSTVIHPSIDYNLLVTLCPILNFNFRNLPIRSGEEMEELLVRRQTFLTPVTYTFLPDRLERWDYTIFFEHGGLHFAMATPDITPNWLSFYYPLSGHVWIAAVASTFVVCIILVKITGSKMWRSRHGRLSTGSVVLEVVGSLLGQGLYGRLSTSHSNHTLVGTWLLFGIVVGTAYRSSLIASLTVPRLPPRPETIEELVKVVDNITMESWGIYWKKFFSASDSPAYRAVGGLIHLGGDITEGLNAAIRTRKQAHLDTERALSLIVSNQFARFDGTSPLYVGKESLCKILGGWAIPHDAPYKPALDGALGYILQAGLYEQWKKEVLETAARERRIKQREELRNLQKEGKILKDSQSTKFRSLTLIHVQGPLLLLLLGLSLGGMIFIVENCFTLRPTQP